MQLTTALLLVAHGSREARANADLEALADQLRRRRRYRIVEVSFLELARPDIDTGAARCVAQGAEEVVMVPYFLSAGIHVRRDLVAACRRLNRRHAPIIFHLAEPLGPHPLLRRIIEERVHQVRGGGKTRRAVGRRGKA
ncbi:MAG: CbiX/SirB N-terminal domain-containing protein [Gemmataceae bacterium]|nr:CbiX/SirB N-terminal domain-containing protein [Gemmataceae bacterium]MDW8266786.1 CbiX/SirB N-terminal domain-containing protein [Gemmataceae bacterium]